MIPVSEHKTHSTQTRQAPLFVQAQLTVNQPGDQYEQEADRVADTVMRMPASNHTFISPFTITPIVQRKCAACSQEEEVQRKETGSGGSVNPSFNNYISSLSGGSSLSAQDRSFFGSRMGYDFSGVKIHTGGTASASATQIQAKAYTYRNNIVFNEGQYQPGTESGRHLLAHELTHVVQQGHGGGSASIQRSCLTTVQYNTPIPGCTEPRSGCPDNFNDEQQREEDRRSARRGRMTPDRMGRTGHGGHASQLEDFLRAEEPARLSLVSGIYINQDLGSDTGAFTYNCDFDPTMGLSGGDQCIFVPGQLNREAFQYNNGAARVGGMPRAEWRIRTLRILIHESQHPLFDRARIAAPFRRCDTPVARRLLSELNSIISEYTVFSRNLHTLSGPTEQRRVMDGWFHHAITNCGESIAGILHCLRWECECTQADNWIRATFNFVATSRGWTAAEQTAFHTELRHPRWAAYDLRWPL